jgi:hypothetical protein
MPIEFAIKILLLQLQLKGLEFFSWSQSVTVGLFHVRRFVIYDDDDDDDDDDDEEDDDDDDDNDDDDDGKNSTYELFFTSNSRKVQTVKFHYLFFLLINLFYSWHSNPSLRCRGFTITFTETHHRRVVS